MFIRTIKTEKIEEFLKMNVRKKLD